jgi:eukaryotic-like serine/threonine-protein kinase
MQYGRYEIVTEVGRGSMGVVYEGHDPNIGRRVALKVLRQDRMGDESFVKRFLREARAIGRLSHPNIVAVYDVGEDQGVVYIAMEFLEGTPLNEIIRDQTLKIGQVIDLGIQVAETLDYAHQKGVVHRDIKPSNIILQADGKIKITDFGIAHIEDASGAVATQVGEIMGTPAYMSPEQVLGKPVDGRTDIFSLGALLYELSAGKRPFGGEGKGLPTIFNEIINVAPQEPVASASLVPAPLSQVIMKCLAKAPEERFQTGKDLADALRVAAQAKAIQPAAPIGQSAPPAPAATPSTGKKKSHTALIVIIVLLLFVSAAGVGGFFLYSRLKSFVGLQSAKILSLPWMKKSEDGVRPPEEKAAQEQQPTKPAEEKPKSATLNIQSQPAGAEISVDGEVKGQSPINLEVPLGAHQVRFTLQGYQDREEEIQAMEAKEYSLSAKLDLIPAKTPAERKTGETSRKRLTKRTSTKAQDGAGGSPFVPEQPRIVTPPPITNQPPPQRVEPKRERPADGWVIKDLKDR